MKRRFQLLLSLLSSLSLILTGTLSVAHAGLIDSSTLMRMEQRAEMLYDIRQTLGEQTVSERMVELGVSPDDVLARVAQLTDEELALLHTRLDDLPAGGNDLLVVLGIVFVVLLVLEALGVTNILRL